MPVEIESMLQHEDVVALLDATAESGVRQTELNELIDTHDFDVLEVDMLYREIETRGIELIDDTRAVEERQPKEPPPPPSVVESTTDALQLFLREAGRHALLTAPQEVELAKKS